MAPPPPVIDPADRLSKLPLEILAQILSFLPAQEAVRTCVLARTWRDAWKFTRRLLITTKSRQFVDRLLRVRLDGLEVASLEASEIRLDADEEFGFNSDDMSSINRWIRRVLKCQIQKLRIDIDTHDNTDGCLEMSKMPLLISQHLTRLELTGVCFICSCVDLDGCPALEHLEINGCFLLGVRKITSQSLKRLVIISSDSIEDVKRIQICVPRLVSLWLDSEDVRTPLLERMPELVRAKVRIDTHLDGCYCEDPMVCDYVMGTGDASNFGSDSDDEEGSGDYAGQNTTKCVVLEGLAQAKDLELIASDRTVHSNSYVLRPYRIFTIKPYMCSSQKIVPADRILHHLNFLSNTYDPAPSSCPHCPD